MNTFPVLLGALCVFAIGYRYYSAYIAARVLEMDDRRTTPAHIFEDGHNYVPSPKVVLFGHHFAAIAGAGPLVGPTLAAQFGFAPGLIWLLRGAVLAGCVQDFIVLVASMRHAGRSLAEIARTEIGPFAGFVAMICILFILVVSMAGLGIVVVNALANSPWGVFTIGCTIPIAIGMGLYMFKSAPGRVRVGAPSAVGVVLLIGAVVAGRAIALTPFAAHLTFTAHQITFFMAAYGFIASVLPIWLLLEPRDYLSTYVKLGTVAALIVGVLFAHPDIKFPAVTQYVHGGGPIIKGPLFPFLFVTIACGAISGFHALVGSGTTPKMIDKESDARLIGYGAMVAESLVGVLALIAACSMFPGDYFAINVPADVYAKLGLHTVNLDTFSAQVGENLAGRTGGGVSLAVGMAQIFRGLPGMSALMGYWYHYAIMFEALFILTTLDAGTRVGRFMVQDLAGHVWKPFGRSGSTSGTLVASAVMVGAWGYFLWQGVQDPLGGINSLWPLFGIANQLLAAVALVVATTILLKMGRKRFVWVTLVPMAWLVAVTMTASWQKIFSSIPRLGFLAQASALAGQLSSGAIPAAQISETQRLIFNNRLDAAVTAVLAIMVLVLVVEAIGEWIAILRGRKAAVLHEAPYVATRWAEGD